MEDLIHEGKMYDLDKKRGAVDKEKNMSLCLLVNQIIKKYKNGIDEPLDGDEVDELVTIIKAKIDLHEGNIGFEEYNEILGY